MTPTDQAALQALLEPVRQRFRQRLPEEIEALLAEWRATDSRALQARLHRLKGTGGTLGFVEISQLASTTEAAVRADDPRGLDTSLAALVAELRRLIG